MLWFAALNTFQHQFVQPDFLVEYRSMGTSLSIDLGRPLNSEDSLSQKKSSLECSNLNSHGARELRSDKNDCPPSFAILFAFDLSSCDILRISLLMIEIQVRW